MQKTLVKMEEKKEMNQKLHKTMKVFNVIIYNFNNKGFEPYNIIPYLVSCYYEREKKPKTFDEFKEFIKAESQNQWWARCEYEIILSPWPYLAAPGERYDKKGEDDVEAWKEHWKKYLNECQKIDAYHQVMMNLDVITSLVMDSINE